MRDSDDVWEVEALVVRWRKSWVAAARMECAEKAIDGSRVTAQAKAESVLPISGWMGDNLLKTRRGGRAKKSLWMLWSSMGVLVTCLLDGWSRAL